MLVKCWQPTKLSKVVQQVYVDLWVARYKTRFKPIWITLHCMWRTVEEEEESLGNGSKGHAVISIQGHKAADCHKKLPRRKEINRTLVSVLV